MASSFAESGSNRALCLLVFGQLFRCQVVGVYGHLGGLATGFYHTFQRFLFVRGISFDCVYEIRYQVGTTLILCFYVRPLPADVFVHGNESVITADSPNGEKGYDNNDDNG